MQVYLKPTADLSKQRKEIYVCAYSFRMIPKGKEKNENRTREKYDYRLNFHGGAEVADNTYIKLKAIPLRSRSTERYCTINLAKIFRNVSLSIKTLKIQFAYFCEKQSWKVE